MIHGGFDDKPGTQKARFCPRGNKLYKTLHEELDFKYHNCGSYVCAIGPEEEKHLTMLLSYGKTNGVPGLEIVNGEILRGREPHASREITAALWSPTASIVNNFEASLAFIDNARTNGVDLFMETEVTGLLFDGIYGLDGIGRLDGIDKSKESKNGERARIRGVSTQRGDFTARVVVNAAGVNSDLISRMAGDDSFTIQPTRGEYFIFDKSVGDMVKSFFFSCPSDKGKGVTVARTADDNLLVGPSAVAQEDRENRDTTRLGLEEIFQGAVRLVPGIPRNMAITNFAGVRANSDKEDFYIKALDRPRGFINVAGIKSPGFTSAPAIALHVVDMMKESLGDLVKFEPNPKFVPERRHIPRFSELTMEEREHLAKTDPKWGQIVCRCESVTEAQVVEAIRRGARTVAGVKTWVRPGTGRCQGGFCAPRVVEILARELGVAPIEITRHGGDSYMLTGKTKERMPSERMPSERMPSRRQS
jgi:glycerol-3-phosphate dehydrogenase